MASIAGDDPSDVTLDIVLFSYFHYAQPHSTIRDNMCTRQDTALCKSLRPPPALLF